MADALGAWVPRRVLQRPHKHARTRVGGNGGTNAATRGGRRSTPASSWPSASLSEAGTDSSAAR
eukprot:1614694-Lingulodinium_polyedra.AAC.1